jgi:hypothetical protein
VSFRDTQVVVLKLIWFYLARFAAFAANTAFLRGLSVTLLLARTRRHCDTAGIQVSGVVFASLGVLGGLGG